MAEEKLGCGAVINWTSWESSVICLDCFLVLIRFLQAYLKYKYKKKVLFCVVMATYLTLHCQRRQAEVVNVKPIKELGHTVDRGQGHCCVVQDCGCHLCLWND